MFMGVPSALSWLIAFVAFTSVGAAPDGSPVLAGPVTQHCLDKPNYATVERGVGRNVTIGGVPTYVAHPRRGGHSPNGIKKVITFYSDVYSPFNVNNQLVQDYFASQGMFAWLSIHTSVPNVAHRGLSQQDSMFSELTISLATRLMLMMANLDSTRRLG